MKTLRWAALCSLALAAASCSSWDQYGATQSQKYAGLSLHQMYEEWGPPVSRTELLTGGRFYQFHKPGTDCGISAWTNALDVVQRLAVSGPTSCAPGS